MISSDFSEKLYARMQEHIEAELTLEELDTLSKIMCSDVMLKALGKALKFCRETQNEMGLLNMADANAVIEFTRGQGQIQGVAKMIAGLLDLITEKDEEEETDND